MKPEAKLLAFLCIATIAGLGGLYIVASSVETVNVPLSQLDPSMAGQRISTQGVLVDVESAEGGAWLTLGSPSTDNRLNIHVKDVADGSALIPGSTWDAVGELVLDDNDYVMFLDDMGGLSLVRSAADDDIPLDVLCRSPEFYTGLTVRVVGDISRTYDHGNTTVGYIEKDSGGATWSMKCVSFGNGTIPTGLQVSVEGTFIYDETRGNYAIEVR